MKRRFVYPGANPLDLDILSPQQNAMVGLAKLTEAVFGADTVVAGLACTPTAPASMQVNVGSGMIYQSAPLEATPFGAIATDTTHNIQKQGLLLDGVVISCPAPLTVGYSINYLIQAAYQDVDGDPTVLSYYNSSNPQQSYSGPNNDGTAQNVTRDGKCVVSVKAGVGAATGTQQTPAADAGYVGLWVVTVAYGQTTIVAGNVAQVTNAPFIGNLAQFDDSNKWATTSFVQRTIGNVCGVATYAAGPLTLDASHAGKLVVLQYSYTGAVNLPLAANMRNGTKIAIWNGTVIPISVNRAGSETIWGNGTGGVNTVKIPGGECVEFVTSGAIWIITSGGFGNSLMSSGYQRLPGGVIMQWGSGLYGDATAVTFPIAFPTGCIQVFMCAANYSATEATPNKVIAMSAYNTTSTGFSASAGTGSTGTRAGSWFAVGY